MKSHWSIAVGYVVLFIMVAFGVDSSSAQSPTYQLVLKNDSLISPTSYEFDISLERTGEIAFELALFQAVLTYDTTIAPAGSLSFTMNVGSSELVAAQQPIGSKLTIAGNELRIAPNTPPGSGNGTVIPASPGLRLGRFRLTSTQPFRDAKANVAWKNSVNPFTKVFAYVNGLNTDVTDSSGHLNRVDNETLAPVLPFVVTLHADSITTTSASLVGMVNPNGSGTVVRFEYSTTIEYGREIVSLQSPVHGSLPVMVSASVTGLLPNTLYHYRLVGRNAAGTSYGADSTFTTMQIPAPAVPVLLVPFNGGRNFDIAQTFVWDSVAGAVSYRVQVANDSLFGNPMIDSTLSSTSLRVDSLPYFTTVSWHVRANNSGGSSAYSPTWWFKTMLNKPVLLSPARDSINVPINPTLRWNAVQGAAWYVLQVATDSMFQDVVFDSAAIWQTSYQLHGLTNYAVYYWRTRAVNAEAISAWSAVWKLTTIVGTPAAVLLAAPGDRAFISRDTVTFRWHAARPLVDRYQLQIATDSLFAHLAIDTLHTDTMTEASGLSNNIVYWWCVRAHNMGGWGLYGDARRFTLSLTGVGDADEIPTTYALSQNYPNPFNPVTDVRYGICDVSHVSLKVYDVLGREVATLVDEVKQPSEYTVRWDASKMPSGVYYYKLVAGSFTDVKKALLLK